MELMIGDISKRYGHTIALNHISMNLNAGIYALLGENGAGKTTLMNILCCLLVADEGGILYDGKDITKLRDEYFNVLGYLPQNFGYYPNFTAYRYQEYISYLKGIERNKIRNRIEELLVLVGLQTEKKEKIRTFSGGMKQRLGIAQALLNEPRILILDEPTSGLDPNERTNFKNYISSLSGDRIIILSTHIVSDVEHIADEILLMKKGQIVKQGAIEVFMEEIQNSVWETNTTEKEALDIRKKHLVSNLKKKIV